MRARSFAASSSKATWLKRDSALRTCDSSLMGNRRRPFESTYANALLGSRARFLELSWLMGPIAREIPRRSYRRYRTRRLGASRAAGFDDDAGYSGVSVFSYVTEACSRPRESLVRAEDRLRIRRSLGIRLSPARAAPCSCRGTCRRSTRATPRASRFEMLDQARADAGPLVVGQDIAVTQAARHPARARGLRRRRASPPRKAPYHVSRRASPSPTHQPSSRARGIPPAEGTRDTSEPLR